MVDLYPEPIERLIGKLSKLPAIGRKSAERLALRFVEMDREEVDAFCEALTDVKTKVHPCQLCGNLTDLELCSVCEDPRRDKSTICVVQDTPNLLAIEKSREYAGLYHVLQGLISPLDQVSSEQINLDTLLERAEDPEVKEIILAINPTVEGEMTTLFLAELLKGKNVKITRIASGIPFGANLEFYDGTTLYKALEDRREL